MNMRAIDISGLEQFTRSPDLSPQPTLDWVDISSLRVDDRYQRPLSVKNWKIIREIAADFDWARFTPVIVATAGAGQYALIDGQHRAHAALLAGIEQIPAMIVSIPVDRQSAAFAAINSKRTGISPLILFRAALLAAEPWAVQLDMVASNAGCQIMTFNRSATKRRPGELYCISILRDHISNGRAAMVERGLTALSRSSVASDVYLYKSNVVRAWLGTLKAIKPTAKLDLARFVSEANLINLCDPGTGFGGVQNDGIGGESNYQWAMRSITKHLLEGKWMAVRIPNKGTKKPVPVVEQKSTPTVPHGPWTADRDALLRDSDGTYRSLNDLAEGWGMERQTVHARWLLVRDAKSQTSSVAQEVSG